MDASKPKSYFRLQSVKKVEVQEALPPAGVIGAEPLTLVPQHFPPQTSVALFAGNSGQLWFFDRLKPKSYFRLKKYIFLKKTCFTLRRFGYIIDAGDKHLPPK